MMITNVGTEFIVLSQVYRVFRMLAARLSLDLLTNLLLHLYRV